MSKEIETQYQQNIVCPYCGYADKDSWEVEFENLEGTTEQECGNCEKTFIVTKQAEITYSSNKTESEA